MGSEVWLARLPRPPRCTRVPKRWVAVLSCHTQHLIKSNYHRVQPLRKVSPSFFFQLSAAVLIHIYSRDGSINFLQGNMGLANAERTLYYIRVLTEFISQPEYRDVVTMFGIINEPTISQDALTSFYLQAHTMIRDITGLGEGHGPVCRSFFLILHLEVLITFLVTLQYIVIHDAFHTAEWSGFLKGSDRIALDTHPYFSFGTISTAPIAVTGDGGLPGGGWPADVCNSWGPGVNDRYEPPLRPRYNSMFKCFPLLIVAQILASPSPVNSLVTPTTAASSCSVWVASRMTLSARNTTLGSLTTPR